MLIGMVPFPLTPLFFFFCRRVPKLFPKYIRAPNGPEAQPVKQLLPGASHHVPPPVKSVLRAQWQWCHTLTVPTPPARW